jgi:hypothetical protein
MKPADLRLTLAKRRVADRSPLVPDQYVLTSNRFSFSVFDVLIATEKLA